MPVGDRGELAEVSRDLGRDSPLKQPLQRRQPAESVVGAFVVVVGDPVPEGKGALVLAAKELARVHAFALDRADEALDSAIGPGVSRLDAAVADPELAAVLVEAALVPVAVVGQDAADADPVGVKERDRAVQKQRGIGRDVAVAQLHIDQATGEVDGDVQMPPPDAAAKAMTQGRETPAAAVEPAELLGVQGHELAGEADLEPAEAARWLWEEVRKPVRAVTAEDPVDRARVHPECAGDAIGAPAPFHSQREDRRLERVGRPPRGAPGPRAAIFIRSAASPPAVRRATSCAHVTRRESGPNSTRLSNEERSGSRRE